MMSRTLLTLLVLAGLTVTATVTGACTQAPEPEQEQEAESEKSLNVPIVDKAIKFHGGELFEKSETELTITSASGSFAIRARLNGDEFDYVVSGKVGRDQIDRRVHWNNSVTEQWDTDEPVELDDEAAQRARDFVNARVYFPYLPYRLNDGNTYKEDLGLEEWDGRMLHKVRVTFAPGTSTDAEDQYLYWFDPDTGRMEQLAYSFVVGQGGLRLRKVIEHTRVDGMLFTDQENYAINGQGMSVNQITPEFAAEQMELMSTVKLTDIKVSPLN